MKRPEKSESLTEALNYICENHGAEKLDILISDRLFGFLADLYKKGKQERLILQIAFSQGIPAKMAAAREKDKHEQQMVMPRYVKSLTDLGLVQNAVEDVLWTYAEALGFAERPGGVRCVTIRNSDGTIYEGEVKNGLYHGKGKFTWADVDVYEGDWVDGKRTGKGTITLPNGVVFEGDFVDDKVHGKGKFTWADGDVYEGDWVDGKRTGKGKLTWADGDIYEGDFVDGERTGKGKFTWANGDVYEGDFVDGKRADKGKFTWASGRVYEGDFV